MFLNNCLVFLLFGINCNYHLSLNKILFILINGWLHIILFYLNILNDLNIWLCLLIDKLLFLISLFPLRELIELIIIFIYFFLFDLFCFKNLFFFWNCIKSILHYERIQFFFLQSKVGLALFFLLRLRSRSAKIEILERLTVESCSIGKVAFDLIGNPSHFGEVGVVDWLKFFLSFRVSLREIDLHRIYLGEVITLHFGQSGPGRLIPPHAVGCLILFRRNVRHHRKRRLQDGIWRQTVGRLLGGRVLRGRWGEIGLLRYGRGLFGGRFGLEIVEFVFVHEYKFTNDQRADRYNINRMNANKDVVYYFDEMIGTYHYAFAHPMKPLRVAMTDQIVRKYQLDNHFDTVDLEFSELHNYYANEEYLTTFHSDEYIDLIRTVTPENRSSFEDQLYRFNFKEDCPVMERLYDYCVSYTTGSIATAALLAQGKYQYGINWSGGLHHAKQSEASGFCYINDCVLAILELLKTYQRVLYIDIDIHHGDGVEEAFYLTDRVMTCSFHKFKDYFPGTGHIDDVGKDSGAYHAVNFPLDEGLDDESFDMIFQPVISKIIENFRPDAILLQGGTDSLSGDRLGCFNLSVKGHGSAAAFLKKFNIPTLFFGGGGYTLRNVPRCWAYETSVVCGVEIPNEIPQNDYSIYFAPEYKIHMPVSNMENQNSKSYLGKTTEQIIKNLGEVNRPGVQLNVNANMPVKIHASEIVREKRDLWENANIDRSNDKPE